MTNDGPCKPRVAVVGGGLAGLAAAVALFDRGVCVELFEQSKRLGGRAGSFQDQRTGQWIDHCQHVAMGCCTNLADFCRRTGIADCFRRYRRLHFFGPDATRYDFAPSRWLPAPLHLLPGLLRLKYLSLGERMGILRTLRRLAQGPLCKEEGSDTIGAWLRRHGQTDRAIDRFWSVVLVGALSETVDQTALAAARKVFVDGFLASRRAYELEVPQVPLDEMFGRRVATWLADRDVRIHRQTRILRIEGDARRARAVVLPDGTRQEFDFVVVAVPWRRIRSMFAEEMLAALPALAQVDRIRPAAITAVHLWFDRPIMPLPHAALVGKLSQWVWRRPEGSGPQATDLPGAPAAVGPAEGAYCQVVISASHALVDLGRNDLVAEVCRELQAIWPRAAKARLLHRRVVVQPAAVFSPQPGVERFRPSQQTPVENLFLAGDWTATGWPATMEGAVRSGYLAAEGLLSSLGSGDCPGFRSAKMGLSPSVSPENAGP